MIKTVKIEGFKRFICETFPLKNLTILAGVNGAGKSSLIQAILLSHEASKGHNTVPLDTAYGVDLGTVQDIMNWRNGKEEIDISLEFNNGVHGEFKFTSSNLFSLYLDVKYFYSGEHFNTENRSFIYLSAERFGPKTEYKFTSKHHQELELGIRGEYCAQLIDSIGLMPINHASRTHPDTPENEAVFLNYQLERWLSEIFRPIKVRSEKYGSNTSSSLQFKVENGEWVKASNMGFGVTYVLPIILAGLVIKENGLLIIENPEAHLHPAGQSKIGEYIGWLSAKGVQVLVETHSDHVLNGIRKSIVAKNNISHKDANVLFFDNNEKEPSITELHFTEYGGLSGWPNSFFDQYQLDTATLGKFRRSRI